MVVLKGNIPTDNAGTPHLADGSTMDDDGKSEVHKRKDSISADKTTKKRRASVSPARSPRSRNAPVGVHMVDESGEPTLGLYKQQANVNDTSSYATKRYHSWHDGIVHNPLGAGSYILEKNMRKALLCYAGVYPITKFDDQEKRSRRLIIHIGAQPNNSPHAGTIITFTTAFILGRELLEEHKRLVKQDNVEDAPPLEVIISLDLVDTAPDDSKTVLDPKTGIKYQKSHRSTQAMERFLEDYYTLMNLLKVHTGISYQITRQADLLSSKWIPHILAAIIAQRKRIGRELAPERGTIALRSACPQTECGLAEKHGILNQYSHHIGEDGTPASIIAFKCLHHGYHTRCISSPEDISKLEFNTPLRNLVRTFVNIQDTLESRELESGSEERYHLRVTGADYSGLYQEQLLFRQLCYLSPTIFPAGKPPPFPLIFYAPLLLDWSGVKLSKSLYVRSGAYEYLKEQGKDYMISFERMMQMGKDPTVLFREVESWFLETKRLFRSYTVDEMHLVFERAASQNKQV